MIYLIGHLFTNPWVLLVAAFFGYIVFRACSKAK